MPTRTPNAPIKVLVFMEATVVNGAAKTLLNFCDSNRNNSSERNDNQLAINLSVATFHRGAVPAGEAANPFIKAVQSRGIEAIVIPERRRFDPQSVKTLRQIVARENPDIIQTNNVKSHALIKMARLYRRHRWLAFHHGYTAPDLKMRLYNQLDRWSLTSAHRVVAVCGPFRDQLIAMGMPSERIDVLHNAAAILEPDNGTDVEAYRTKFSLDQDGSKILVAVGRLSSEKGHADLLKALHHLRSARPELKWKLILVGSGPEQQNLEAMTRQLGLESQVIFASQQGNVLPFYRLADAMVLPSHSEGSPHVVLEAMSAGVPIVATNVGGIPEILKDGKSALLVPSRNAEALSAAIANMLDSPDMARQLATEAKEVLRQRFSHESYRRSLLKIYQDLLQ